jgi:hypothetical protein
MPVAPVLRLFMAETMASLDEQLRAWPATCFL